MENVFFLTEENEKPTALITIVFVETTSISPLLEPVIKVLFPVERNYIDYAKVRISMKDNI